MFCVIQEVQTKKENKNGYYKELRVKYMEMSVCGKDESHYYYEYGGGRFERTVKKAYRISVHQSYRKNGKVRKKQFAICTVGYYDIADGWFSLYDWGYSKVQHAAKELDCPEDTLYDLINAKLEPLVEAIQEEFYQTEEYRVHEEHERITTLYAANKAIFNEKYGDEYDKIYDVFGTLRNPERLEQVKTEYKFRKEYEQKSRGYQEDFWSNYTSGGYGLFGHSTYNDTEKDMLKKFYRTLSKKYHPDSNLGTDTSGEMQLLNKLKNEWGL